MVGINLDGFSLANRLRFAKFAKLSPRQTFPLYGILLPCYGIILDDKNEIFGCLYTELYAVFAADYCLVISH